MFFHNFSLLQLILNNKKIDLMSGLEYIDIQIFNFIIKIINCIFQNLKNSSKSIEILIYLYFRYDYSFLSS